MNEMRWKEFVLQLTAIVIAAVVCALVANLFAANERKLVLAGHYPNALAVTRHEDAQPTTIAPIATATVAWATTATVVAPGTAAAMVPNVAPDSTRAAAPVHESHSPAPTTTAPAPATKPARPSNAELLARFPTHEKVAYVEIGGDDVAWLHAAGVPFLDARRSSVYDEGHIAGARSFPVWEADIDDRVKSFLDEGRDGKLPIVVYCSGGDCEDSHMLAEKLWGVFFNDILVYKDGFPDWQKRGGPIQPRAAIPPRVGVIGIRS